MAPVFHRLNSGWNADPNAPDARAQIDACDVILRFDLNTFEFPEFAAGEKGVLRFVNCTRFRLGGTNDEGWYLGQCRFAGQAPAWGEFYAITGDPESTKGPDDWVIVQSPEERGTHFLFYFRDNTFECVAEMCVIEPTQRNALFRASKSIPLN